MASYLIVSPLREKFARGAYSLCFYTLLWLRYLPVSLMSIKGLKEYKQVKMANFAGDTIIFLRDIRIDRTQVISKLYEDASSSKIKFKKSSLCKIS